MTVLARPTVSRGRQSDQYLKLTYERKTSPAGWWQESRRRWVPKIPNAFGLPSVTSCPGSTSWCRNVCYAARSEQSAGVRELVEHNLRLLQEAGTVAGMRRLLAEMLGRYVREADRVGLPAEDRWFRWHWDGDWFSADYAEAAAAAMRGQPTVRHWCYTRSFVPPVDVVPVLATVENLALYLSADPDNSAAAAERAASWPNVRVAWCADDYSTARSLPGAADRRPVVCPENAERMPLMGSNGRGACMDCGICPQSRRDVIFSSTHREHADQPKTRTKKPAGPGDELRLEHCGNPTCSNLVVAGPGRRQVYCQPVCRWFMYHRRTKGRRRGSLVG